MFLGYRKSKTDVTGPCKTCSSSSHSDAFYLIQAQTARTTVRMWYGLAQLKTTGKPSFVVVETVMMRPPLHYMFLSNKEKTSIRQHVSQLLTQQSPRRHGCVLANTIIISIDSYTKAKSFYENPSFLSNLPDHK